MSRTGTGMASVHGRPTRSHRTTRLVQAFALAGVLLMGMAQAQAELKAVLNHGSLATQDLVVGAGYRTLNLVNQNGVTTEFTVYRLRKGGTLASFEAANQAFAQATAAKQGTHAAIQQLSSTAAALSGVSVSKYSTKTMLVDLRQGTYVIAARPKGSDTATYSSFTVVGPAGGAAGGPQVATTVNFSDFAFNFPARVNSGATLWKVTNTGTQPHVADFYRLLPGKTSEDLVAYLGGNGGRAPYDKTANIAMVAEGETVYVPVSMSAGNWVAVCFVPDMDDASLTHVMEGMISEFQVY